MVAEFERQTDGELLAVLDAALDELLGDRPPSDTGLLALPIRSLRVGARLAAWQQRLAAQVEADEVAWREHGTSTTTWLAEAARLTPREARRLVTVGQGLDRFAGVGAAAAAGRVLPGQAEAITGVLGALPDDLPAAAVAQAQELLVGFADDHNAVELRRLTGRLVEVLDPEGADVRESTRLEREHRLALRNRHLRFVHDHQGSVLIRGSLPVAEAEPFIRIIDAYAAAGRRGLDRLDPLAEHRTPAMWRADALLAMLQHHGQDALAPSHGGDRPRVVVTLSYDKLVKAARDGGLLSGGLAGSGDPVDAGTLRRWLCDADVLPVVLGGSSEVLDVGRSERCVTPAIRTALEARDGGCIFPGCDAAPRDCHAHHIVPWWTGGVTAVRNLVLVCPHHHGIVEPGRRPGDDRWHVRLTGDVAEVLPPLRVDPARRPRRHARFLSPRRE